MTTPIIAAELMAWHDYADYCKAHTPAQNVTFKGDARSHELHRVWLTARANRLDASSPRHGRQGRRHIQIDVARRPMAATTD